MGVEVPAPMQLWLGPVGRANVLKIQRVLVGARQGPSTKKG